MVAKTVDSAEVRLWGHSIGAVYWDPESQLGAFEYEPKFQHSGIELAPLMMPLGPTIFRFPDLRRTSFRGLPGLLADSMPDDFGNAIIDQWLIREGRERASFSPVERLCYIGNRGMGALEFRPAIRNTTRGSVRLDVGSLVDLAQQVLDLREGLKVRIAAGSEDYGKSLDDILRVGTSAGGARAKAVIAWNRESGEMRSGQVRAPDNYEYWLLKFDGVGNREHGIRDPQGYGRIELAYSLMAKAAGIEMSECRLLHEGGRSHFMTRRFDRRANGEKLHMQSLYALAHLDNELAGAHSYEQAFQVIQEINAGNGAVNELYRRMIFNVIARNQDDHTKNISFLMEPDGNWRLAPAFDVIWAYNPDGDWTSKHQMSINGKLDHFVQEDLLAVARRFRVSRSREIIETVAASVARWPEFAEAAEISAGITDQIASTHRTLD